MRPDGRNRVGHQRDIGVVVGEERGAGAGHVEQELLVLLGDRHADGGQHRTGIGDQQIDVVLGDELVVQRGGGGGAALVVIGDQLDGDLLAERFHLGPACGVDLVHPQLERVEHRHGDAGVGTGAGIERADLDLGGGRGLGVCRTGGGSAQQSQCQGLGPHLRFLPTSFRAACHCDGRSGAPVWSGVGSCCPNAWATGRCAPRNDERAAACDTRPPTLSIAGLALDRWPVLPQAGSLRISRGHGA